jgi:hypothetical protein
MKLQLFSLAHGRSGDKGDSVNVGIIARKPEYYEILRAELTAERVKNHFGEMVLGKVERYDLANIGALNFLLHNALGGGGTKSLKLDAQGKTFAAALLRMELDLDETLYPQLKTVKFSRV